MALGTDEINSYPGAFSFKGRQGQPIQSDEYNGLLVSQTLPRLTRINQGGRLYTISTAAGTAKAPITSIGTTSASFALWNGNAVTTKYCLVIEEIVAFLVSGTSGTTGASMMAGLSPTVQAAAVSGYSGVIGPKSQSNSTGRTSQAVIGGAITLAGAPVWRHLTGIQTAPVAGGTILHQTNGGIIVPPYAALGFEILSAAGTTPLWGWTITYAEIELDLD